ncbi:metalloproteinase inhibitor 2-like [Anneissia japonica]|uniref:metalloproteinase inhibitor 2-like n=1 Tax=Anneissia japonica TaxID=1529436 RepID=UPI001425602C|nr:metalloproteinase inhibitor 2-like [Anneissia japonica]
MNNFGINLCLAALIILLELQVIFACQCGMPKHPQRSFCESDYVIKVKVIEKTTFKDPDYVEPTDALYPSFDNFWGGMEMDQYIPEAHKIKYSVYVEKVYKGEQYASRKTKIELETSASSGICGITYLKEGERYLIGGVLDDDTKEFTIALCDTWIEKFEDVTKTQRQGIKRFYKKYCNQCAIEAGDIFFPPEVPAKMRRICGYSPFNTAENDCEKNFSACVRLPDGSCGWMNSKSYKQCVKARKDKTPKKQKQRRNKKKQ